MRLLWLALGLAVLFLIPFVLWGDALEAAFSHAGVMAWLGGYGRWAWAAALGLLVSDLLLPIPASVVMTAVGLLYGPVVGGLLNAAGSFLAGAVAYGCCRALGRGAAVRLLGAADLARGERLFARAGGWLVVASRWLPVLPEVVACVAGLTRMPAGRFHLALACGALPVGVAFAALGHAGADRPVLALVLSALVPPLLWLVVRPFVWTR